MRRRALRAVLVPLALLALLAVPGVAYADSLEAAGNEVLGDTVPLNTMWVLVAAVLVLFMQAGFALLEIGFSRAKNAGTGIAKILTNLSIAAIAYYACGFAFAFGTGGSEGDLIGTTGFLLQDFGDPQEAFFPSGLGLSDATIESKWLFQFAFCAVSLAIVWGTTLERIKYSAYVVYAVVFAAVIYPIGSHWVFGGGWLQSNLGMQDFAGSTAVHLIGATGALAALLLLGPRKGKYGPDGKPRAIPGHSMPLVGLGIIILFIGWFGFNAGSTLNATDSRFAEVAMVTMLGAAAGVLGAFITTTLFQRTIDIGMVGNGMIAGLVGITAPSGYVEAWAAIPIGLVAGLIVVAGVITIDKKLDDPVGALSAHGLAGIWGTLACGIFSSPDLAAYNAFGKPGLVYNGSFDQLGTQALGVVTVFGFVFLLSIATFAAIKATIGLRVTEEEEDAGLDIVEHGMYGYPEQFIPAPEIGAASTGPAAPAYAGGSASPVTAMRADAPAAGGVGA
ncbi:MAG TPA: ammonium transporter [Thermoleophilaceae bacterium]